jgi:brefeldin A-resistance guanine nucleotide exchange factor 1
MGMHFVKAGHKYVIKLIAHTPTDILCQIFEMFQNLFLHSLLPTRMLQMEDFLGGVSMIPLRGNQPSRSPARSDGGLLSALSSYLMTPYGSSTEMQVSDATDADVENTLCTIDCITSCRLDELYGQIM